ncbi:MAG: hypothetical protein NTW86_16650 [Candidatus Sumerlaeota bacterium]|nr:hypothetical protein [Candidatus Sumerlaeota bacterium]
MCCGSGKDAASAATAASEETTRYGADADPAARTYREAMGIALQGVIDWAGRYARAAEEASRAEADLVLREAHQRVAEACRRVPALPARNLFEGLQAIVLTHLAIYIEGHGVSVSVGLPDRVLAPFVGDGFDSEFATNLIAAFMLKLTANSALGRSTKTQAITVGGVNHRGEDQCNAVTRCFLDAAEIARVGDPHLFLRWHDNIDPAVKDRAIELLASGLSMPLLINDTPTVNGFMGAGFAAEEAWEYCVIGCNELGIPGRSAESATARHGSIQYLAILNNALLNHPDPDAISDMPALMGLMEQTMRKRLGESRAGGEKHKQRDAEAVPTPFTSSLMTGCIGRGQDLHVGMDHQVPALYERGLTNATNALAAIERLVFQERSIRMSQLLDAMRGNFVDGATRKRLLAAPKWGNDDERADRWAVALVRMRERVLDDIDRQFGHRPHFVCHVVRSMHHIDSFRLAASPDGRLAGTPTCESIGAQTGTARKGVTALLNSVLKLDAASQYRGGYNLNLTLPKASTTLAALRALVETFFSRGGQELQINCLNAETLRSAQREPEKHGDLVVRLAGMSARFVDLSPVVQEEIIQRAEAMV